MVTSVWVATQFPKRIIFFKEQLNFSKNYEEFNDT